MPVPRPWSSSRLLVRSVVLAWMVAAAAPSVRALPSFSRSTGYGCDTCHDGVPRLNATGYEFLRRGYRFAPAHEPRISRALPLSVIGTAGLGADERLRLRDPDGPAPRPRDSMLELHSAGVARARWSWHLDQRLGSANGTLETRTAALQLDDLAGNGALQLRVGKFESGLRFLAASRRPTLAPYLAPVSLDVDGLEMNGTRGAWDYAAGVTEDHRTRAPGMRVATYGAHLQDPYFWIERRVAGQWIGGRMWFDRQDSDLPFHTWLQHMQHEVAASLGNGRVQVTPAYVLDRYDDRPAAELHDKHHLALLEVVTAVDRDRRWWLSGRVEHEYRPRTPFTPEHDRQRAALDLAFDARPDTRFALEWSHGADNVGGPRVDALDAFVRVGY